MKGTCNYLSLNNERCNSTYLLHEVYFRNPEHKLEKEFIDICKTHYDEIIREMQEQIKILTRTKDNLKYSIKLARSESRKQDIIYDASNDYSKLDNIITRIKTITNSQCRNDFCNKELMLLGNQSKIWTAHTFKPNGKRHLSFNFCCLNCMNRLRSKCGLPTMIQRGQLSL